MLDKRIPAKLADGLQGRSGEAQTKHRSVRD